MQLNLVQEPLPTLSCAVANRFTGVRAAKADYHQKKKTLEEPRKPPHFTVCQNRNYLAGAKQTDKQTNKRKEFYGEQTEQVNIYNV